MTPDTPIGYSHNFLVDHLSHDDHDFFLRWYEGRYREIYHEGRPVYSSELVEFFRNRYIDRVVWK